MRVAGHLLTVQFSALWEVVDERLRKLAEAQALVVEDPEILSGTPVVRGTRIPVHQVAALFDTGHPVEEIVKIYPRLTKSQVELASIYAKAVPQRGRPKRLQLPPGTRLISTSRGSLKSRDN